MFDEEAIRQLARDCTRAGEAYHACADALHQINRLSEQLPQAQHVLAESRAFIQTLVSSYASPETVLHNVRAVQRQLLLLPEQLHALAQAHTMDAAEQAALSGRASEEEWTV